MRLIRGALKMVSIVMAVRVSDKGDNSTPEKDKLKKGFVVSRFFMGWDLSLNANALYPIGHHVQITVDDMNEDEGKERATEWRREIDIELVSNQPELGLYRANIITSNRRNSDGKGGISRADVEFYLKDWNSTFHQHTKGVVTFNTDIKLAAKSQAMHDSDVVMHNFTTELQVDNTVNVTQDYSQSGLNGNDVLQGVNARRPRMVSHDVRAKVMTYNLSASDIYREMKKDLQRELNTIISRRSWQFSEATVDQAIALADAGQPPLVLTRAQTDAVLIDNRGT
jgi:hypothetical protein